jgi:hypothetical protein
MHTIHNARVTLFATALHNLGVGAIIAGIVAPMVRGEINGLISAIVWLVIGLDFIGMAQVLLGRLRS